MHQEQTTKQEIQLPGHPPIAPEPTTLDYVKEFNLLIIAALVPLGLAYIGYLTVKRKTEASNREAQREAVRKDEEYVGDKTVMDFMRSEMTKTKEDREK